MKTVLAAVAIVIFIALGAQTYQSASSHEAAIVCPAAEVLEPECLGLSSLGGVRKSGVIFVARAFARHAREMPSDVRETIRNFVAKFHLFEA